MHDTNLKNIKLQHKNSAKDTNVTNNQLQIKENSAEDPSVTNN